MDPGLLSMVDFNNIFLPLQQSQQAAYIIVASMVVFVCDLFYTLPDEVEYIWKVTAFVVACIFFGMTLYKLRKNALEIGVTNAKMAHSPIYRAFIRGGAVSFLSVALIIPIAAGITIGVNNPITISCESWISLALSLASKVVCPKNIVPGHQILGYPSSRVVYHRYVASMIRAASFDWNVFDDPTTSLHSRHDLSGSVRNYFAAKLPSTLTSCETGASAYVDWNQARETAGEVFLTVPSYPMLGCLAFSGRREVTLAVWVTAFVIAAIFFAMTIYKLYQNVAVMDAGLSNASNAKSALRRSSKSPIYNAFIRGGALSFLLVALVIPINAGITIGLNNPFIVSCEPWISFALSLAGTRLILTLRHADAKVQSSGGEQSILGMETWEAGLDGRSTRLSSPIAFGSE
ncbi:hypothetical protein CVT24_007244 [Panaeolus cyanescens]|uniref:DUF6533 domain-containing protein n=1 Tax=Panaeolus cyanescens TaxID=181874 RepID=A0A409YPC6_9AGAR|nr:hypothetical protein CVT24_007244 [Panaeolus cyanescens]